MSLENRKADFQRRATYASHDVYVHISRPVRYIPVHAFADEGALATGVDAWCDLSTDVALVETIIAKIAHREVGIWIRRDRDSPRFLKVLAVLDCPAIARRHFEDVLAAVADHPWSATGFAGIAPGGALEPLAPSS